MYGRQLSPCASTCVAMARAGASKLSPWQSTFLRGARSHSTVLGKHTRHVAAKSTLSASLDRYRRSQLRRDGRWFWLTHANFRSSTKCHVGSRHTPPLSTRFFASTRVNRQSGPDHDDTRQDTSQRKHPTPVTQGIETARETTRAVRDKVQSTIGGLTPHENIYNLPNFLTVSRLFAAPATAYLLLHDHHAAALALFAYAGITDLVDGWLARKWNLQTVAGSVIDPMADKALMIILTVTLAVKSAMPLSLAVLILGRDAALAVAAIYYRYASLPAPKTFLRYWDFSLPSAEVHPTTVSKYNTFLQLILIGSTLALPVLTGSSTFEALGLNTADASFKWDLHGAMTAFQCLVAGTTAWSGLSYAFLPNAVTILGSDPTLKAKQGARGRAIIGLTFGSVVLGAMMIASRGRGSSEQTPRDEDAGQQVS